MVHLAGNNQRFFKWIGRHEQRSAAAARRLQGVAREGLRAARERAGQEGAEADLAVVGRGMPPAGRRRGRDRNSTCQIEIGCRGTPMRFYEVVTAISLVVHPARNTKPLPTFALYVAARLFFLAACLFCSSSAFSIAVPSSQLAVSTRAMSPVVMGAKAPPKSPSRRRRRRRRILRGEEGATAEPAAKKAAPGRCAG